MAQSLSRGDLRQSKLPLSIITPPMEVAPPEIYLSWFQTLQKSVFQIFEKATLESTPEHLDLKRIISAQQILRKKFYGNKTVKNLQAKAIHEEAA